MSEPIKFENVPLSVYQQQGLNGGPSRRVFIEVTDLATIPEELFAIKMSQSKNPELAGKPMFKYFGYKVNENTPFSALAPTGTTLATPVSENKQNVIGKLGQLPDAKFSLAINLNGTFANIKAGDGVLYTIFDDKEFAQTDGKPGYYIKKGAVGTVELEMATSQFGPYYQVHLSTDLNPDDLFVRAGKSKVWGGAADTTDIPMPTAEDEPVNDGGVW